jgi:prephenate dehydratase
MYIYVYMLLCRVNLCKNLLNSAVTCLLLPFYLNEGGSIHTNFDLLLRYDLHIIAEHEFKVEHTLLALPGTKKADIKKVMSHPQAL